MNLSDEGLTRVAGADRASGGYVADTRLAREGKKGWRGWGRIVHAGQKTPLVVLNLLIFRSF